MLVLYDYFRSSAAFRTRIALNYKRLKYTKQPVNLKDGIQNSDSYLSINPAGLVPAMVDSMEGKQDTIYQSLAIIEYLDEKYPNLPRLLPDDLKARAYVREIALTIACDIHPLNNLRVLNYLTHELKHNDKEKDTWYQHWIQLGLNSLEEVIKNRSNNMHSKNQHKYYTGKYCYGDQFSIADACLIPQLFNARRFNCDLNQYPTLCAIENECLLLDAVKLAYPKE